MVAVEPLPISVLQQLTESLCTYVLEYAAPPAIRAPNCVAPDERLGVGRPTVSCADLARVLTTSGLLSGLTLRGSASTVA